MVEKRRITVGRFLLALLVTVFLGMVWWVPFEIGNFYQHQGQYAGDVLRGNASAAREDLVKLEYFYRWNNVLDNFWLDGPANKYLFYNAPYYRSSLDYLRGLHTKVDKDLKNDNSFWALYMRGNAKFRIAQDSYKHGLEMKDKKEGERIKKEADDLAYSSKDEYEEAIRNDPGQTFPPKWNYDLITDKDARQNALSQKPKIRLPFGYPDPRGIPSGGPKLPLGSSEDLDKKIGPAQPKRGG